MTLKPNATSVSLTSTQILFAIEQSLFLIKHYAGQIIDNKYTIFGIPMSVELRRLYGSARGNFLLKRFEEQFNVSLQFSIIESYPNTYKTVGIDEYMGEVAFVSHGKSYQNIDVIDLVANERGAHTDDAIDVSHYHSSHVQIGWENPAESQLVLPVDLHSLLCIARNTCKSLDQELPRIRGIIQKVP